MAKIKTVPSGKAITKIISRHKKVKGRPQMVQQVVLYPYKEGGKTKYISKTIYKTFQKKELEKELKVDMSNLQMGDFFIA